MTEDQQANAPTPHDQARDTAQRETFVDRARRLDSNGDGDIPLQVVIHHLAQPADEQRSALMELINTIDATGGLQVESERPAGDPSWVDLGHAYLAACRALGKKPLYQENAEHARHV